MKKAIKIFAIIGLICLMAGTGVSITAAALGGTFKGTILSYGNVGFAAMEGPIEAARSHSFSSVEHLDIELEASSVEVITGGEGSEIMVSFGGDTDEYEAYMDGNNLEIRYERNARKYRRRYQRLKDIEWGQVQIVIPKNYQFEQVSIDMDASDFSAEELHTNKMELDINAGSVDIKKASVRDLEADCNAGDIRIQLDGKKEDYNYEVDCAVGDVKIGNSQYAGLSTSQSIHNEAMSNVELSCQVGSIEISFP